MNITLDTPVRYREGSNARIIAISSDVFDVAPVIVVTDTGIITRHTLTGKFEGQQTTTKSPWDLVPIESNLEIAKLQEEIERLQAMLKSERAKCVEIRDDLRQKYNTVSKQANDLRAENQHRFAELQSELLKEQRDRRILEVTVKQLREQNNSYMATRVTLEDNLSDMKQSQEKLLEEFDQKTQTIAANNMITDLQNEARVLRGGLAEKDKQLLDAERNSRIMKADLITLRDQRLDLMRCKEQLEDAGKLDKDTIEHLHKGLKLERDKRVKLQAQLKMMDETSVAFERNATNQIMELKEENARLEKQLDSFMGPDDTAIPDNILFFVG